MSTPNDGNAGPEKTSDDNLGFAELVSLRAGATEEPDTEETTEGTEESEETETEETEEQSEETEEEETEESEDDEEETEEEGQEVDLLDLTPEQIQELAKKGKSRLLKRVGQLTAEKNAMESRLAALEAQANQAPEVPQDSNPFRDIDSLEKIEAKRKELARTLETTDDLLDEHEGYGPDDIITVGEKQFTKRDIRKANKNARDALAKYLPAQAAHLHKLSQFEAAGKQFQERAKQEVPEIQDEESEIGKNFKALISDPLVDRVKREIPELGMQIEFILAHAARSIFGKKSASLKPGSGTKLKAKPPAFPGGSGTQKLMKSGDSRIRELEARVDETGSIEDLVALRTEKHSR